jgi:hypothetical protein
LIMFSKIQALRGKWIFKKNLTFSFLGGLILNAKNTEERGGVL